MDGIGFIPAMIGLFGISEVLKRVQQGATRLQLPPITEKVKISPLEALKIIWKEKITLIKSAFVGTFIGALPGAGADIAAWVAYGVEKKTSKNSEDFGTGNIKGVIAPTSANNAALGGTWIPALVFGVPGDTITAIVLGAMLMYGLKPGPLIFKESRELVNGVFGIAVLANILMIPIGYLGIKAFAQVLKLKTSVVLTGVVLFSMIGSYAIRNSYFDIYVMLAFGFIGYIMERLAVPLAPMILGIILGPMVEDNLRVGLIKTGGSMNQFFTRPISLVLILLILLVFFGGPTVRLLKKVFKSKKS
jgi:TctA family transporter